MDIKLGLGDFSWQPVKCYDCGREVPCIEDKLGRWICTDCLMRQRPLKADNSQDSKT